MDTFFVETQIDSFTYPVRRYSKRTTLATKYVPEAVTDDQLPTPEEILAIHDETRKPRT